MNPIFSAIDLDLSVLCDHGKPSKRCVAFEGMHMGRRFLACVEDVSYNFFVNGVLISLFIL